MSKVVKKERWIKILYAWLCKNPGTIILFLAVLLIGISWAVIVLESATDFFTKNMEILKNLGFGLSGLTALYGLVALNRRAEAQVENNRLTEKGLSQERFKTAVEHLSDDNRESLRMASFYEFFHLAKDNKKDYGQTVADILCAHLRQKTKSTYFDKVEHEKSSLEDLHSEEVIALVDILFGEKTAYVFDGLHHDLRGVNLVYFHFKLKDRRREIDFSHANLSRANFNGGDLSECEFQKAELYSTNFEKTILHKADFTDADITCAYFSSADLSNARFINTIMCHASFPDTNLEEARSLQADLRGANFRDAKFLEFGIVWGTYNEGTKFPDGVNPKDHKFLEYSPYSWEK